MRHSSSKPSQTKSAPKSNVVSERDFTQLDCLSREKPNATTIVLEGIILYANNQTGAWLDCKSIDDHAEILKIATKLTPEYKKLFNKRREDICCHVAETLTEKEREIIRKKQHLLQQKEKLVKSVAESERC